MATNCTLNRQLAYFALILCVAVFLCGLANAKSLPFSNQKTATDHPVSNASSISLKKDSLYVHSWPELKFGWKIAVGSLIGFLGAAFGSVGGVGGGVIYVPMMTLIIGFDEKSSTALSKCMVTAAGLSTVYYNLGLRHPSLDTPLIDYDLALIFQPMLMLGISIGVILNVIVADWIITLLLIILFSRNFIDDLPQRCSYMEEGIRNEKDPSVKYRIDVKVPILQNIHWKELGLLSFVWIAFLIIQIVKKDIANCSALYWILNALQIPIAASVTLFEVISLRRGTKVLKSTGKSASDWKIQRVLFCSFVGITAGMMGGLLGLGGGFIMGPLFLELGVPPQVASATSTFIMTFSSSLAVIQYYLLKRFPVPHALYWALVGFIAALVGQHLARKVIAILGRSSIIIFILAFLILIGAISLGGVGTVHAIHKLNDHEYMGFYSLCHAT